jgi:hypothetical protein
MGMPRGGSTAHFAGTFDVNTIWSPTFSAVNCTLSPGLSFASAAGTFTGNYIAIGPMPAFGISLCFNATVFAFTSTLRISPSTCGTAAIGSGVARLDVIMPAQRWGGRAPPQEGGRS